MSGDPLASGRGRVGETADPAFLEAEPESSKAHPMAVGRDDGEPIRTPP
jgi:hypothetical protein